MRTTKPSDYRFYPGSRPIIKRVTVFGPSTVLHPHSQEFRKVMPN